MREADTSGDFFQRGGLWVVGQFALMGGVVAGGLIWHGQWHSLGVTACGIFLLTRLASFADFGQHRRCGIFVEPFKQWVQAT